MLFRSSSFCNSPQKSSLSKFFKLPEGARWVLSVAPSPLVGEGKGSGGLPFFECFLPSLRGGLGRTRSSPAELRWPSCSRVAFPPFLRKYRRDVVLGWMLLSASGLMACFAARSEVPTDSFRRGEGAKSRGSFVLLMCPVCGDLFVLSFVATSGSCAVSVPRDGRHPGRCVRVVELSRSSVIFRSGMLSGAKIGLWPYSTTSVCGAIVVIRNPEPFLTKICFGSSMVAAFVREWCTGFWRVRSGLPGSLWQVFFGTCSEVTEVPGSGMRG